jgi:hypothetical protein
MPKLTSTALDALLQTMPHGVWIWRLAKIDPHYLDRLEAAHCRRVYLKVFDDKNVTTVEDFFWDFQCSNAVIKKFNNKGIDVVGWGYHFDQRKSIPVKEEAEAVKRAIECGLTGYVIDVEAEVESLRTHTPLKELLEALRSAVGDKFLGYTSFGHPGLHSQVPWKLLDDGTDIAFPQIYFEKWRFGASDADEIAKAIAAHGKLGLSNPICPIWGSEEDATQSASAAILQAWLDQYPGSSIFRIPNLGQKGQAWNLDYAGTAAAPRPAPSPPPAEPLDFYRGELRQGPKGNTADQQRVTLVQQALAARGFDPGSIDGEFGPTTAGAVRRFQFLNDLTPDGIVGPLTWLALDGTLPEGHRDFPARSRDLLASVAEAEGSLGLRWTGANSAAEKYLEPLRGPMQALGHIGTSPVFYNWCAAFVVWCARQAGFRIPDRPRGHGATMALAEMWRTWAKDEGYWYPKGATIPQRGDIVCLEWFDGDTAVDHIGIVRQGPGGGSTFLTAEGNRNNQTVNGTRYLANIAGIVRLRDD